MSSYEEYVIKIFLKDKISFRREKTFSDLKKGKFRFDFYVELEKENIIIEVDGEFHFKQIFSRKQLLKQQENDRRKNSYCLANNIKLYRIPYWVIKNGQIKDFTDMINEKFLVKSRWHNDELTPRQ